MSGTKNVGTNQCVCPDGTNNTQNRANTQIRPYRKNESMKHKANSTDESTVLVSYVGAGFKPAPTKKRTDLPDGWGWKTMGEICNTTSGGTPSRAIKEYFKGNIPWVKSGELPDGLVIKTEEYITKEAVKNSSAKIFPSGTLLIAMYGATVGKLGIINREAATNQAVCAIFPHKELDTKYLFWYLKSLRADLISKSMGGAQPNISQGILRNIPFPLAPLDQQKLIVAEIEKQFSRLDEAVAALKRIQANLKRYKTSVLKAAVEGKLTEEWRSRWGTLQRAPTKDETGADLLKRILTERKKKWEEDYIKKHVGAHGHAPEDDSWKKKYKEPTPPDTAKLTELPKGWAWATYDQIGEWTGGGTPTKTNASYWANGTIPWISPKDMKTTKIHDTEDKITKTALNESSAKLIAANSLLFVVRSGILRRILPIALIKIDAAVNQDIKALTPNRGLFSEYLLLSSLAFSENIRHSCQKDGTTVESIEVPALQTYSIPLPPAKEQEKIFNEVESRLSVTEEIEETIDTNLKRAERLRQSILKEAFSGKLV